MLIATHQKHASYTLAPLNSSLSIMTNHSLVLAAMLVATLSTATSYLLEYPTIPELAEAPIGIANCVGVYGKDHQNYGTAFFLVLSVVNLCDDHNPFVQISLPWLSLDPRPYGKRFVTCDRA